MFFVIIENPLSSQIGTAIDTPYLLCKDIINILKRLFKAIPSLRSLFVEEVKQMIIKTRESKQLNPPINDKIIIELIPLCSILEKSMKAYFLKLPEELQLNYFLANGKAFGINSFKIAQLCEKRIISDNDSSLLIFLYNQTATCKLFTSFDWADLHTMLIKCLRITIRIIEIRSTKIFDLIPVGLFITVSMNHKVYV